MQVRNLLTSAMMAMVVPVHAQDAMPHQPVATEALVGQVCAACHGLDGNSVRPGVPSLAGQIEPYLERQLHAFAAQGGQRANGVMGAIAVNLSADEMRRVSDHFARQPLQPTRFVDTPRRSRAEGRMIYLSGLVKKNVASCASCHGTSGSGLTEMFPRLAGQHAPYIAEQLRHFRSGSRTSDPDAMMRIIAARMTDSEIDAVSNYVARLR